MKQQEQTKPITFEDARILFRNFEGREEKFNPPGRRSFCVLLDPKSADVLAADGWNVRWLEPREEGDARQPYLQVSVSYKARPPKIVMISETSKNKTFLTEDTVHIIDWADIKTVDFIVTPYHWDVNGKTGIKAYLKKMFITLEEDELELKYADTSEHSYEGEFDDEELD